MISAVYTYWTGPKSVELADVERTALSTHFARKWLGPLTLVADSDAARMLERSGIEFEHVDTRLDRFEGLDPEFWAAAKLETYLTREEPFIHLDNDVFLFGGLPDRILTAGLFAQSPEFDDPEWSFYKGSLSKFSPEDTAEIATPIEEWRAYNAGIFGGHDVEFFQRYAERALEWGRRITREGKAHRWGMTLMEQALFAKMAHEEGRHVECLLQHRSDNLARQIGYTHLVDAKTNPRIQERVRMRLRSEAPAVYTKIRKAYGAAI